MGTTLTGKNISASYLGLLKSTDNLAISSSAKTITDGAGNDLPIKLSTAQFLVSDGSSSAPTIGFSSDTDTGLYRTGSGVLGITSNSTLSAEVTLTGFRVRKNSTASAPNYTFIGDDNTGLHSLDADRLDFILGGNRAFGMTYGSGVGTLQTLSTDKMAFSVGGSERLRIINDGKIGIGTSTVTASAFMEIKGVGSLGTAIVKLIPSDATSTTALYNTSDGGDNAMSQYGTASGDTILQHIASSGELKLRVNGTTGLTMNQSRHIKLDAYGGGSITGTVTQRLGVDSSGNVVEIPIGSGAVDGSGTAGKITKWSDSDTITDSIMSESGSTITMSGGADTILKVVGTSTASRLDLQTDSHHRFLQTIESDGRFRLYNQTTSAEQLTVLSDGKVGINTTSPDSYSFGGQIFNVSAGSSYSNILITQNGTNVGGLQFGNGTIRRASIEDINGSGIKFSTNTTNSGTSISEQMRLDSSGNLLVGKTSNTLATAGAKLGTGGSNFTRDSAEVVFVNRTTDDGSAITIAKDGTSVGVIGTQDWIIGSSSLRSDLGSSYTQLQVGGTVNGIIDIDNSSALAMRLSVDGNLPTIASRIDGQPLRFSTNSGGTVAERMRILSGGQVSIGGTLTTAKLNVLSSSYEILRLHETDSGGGLLRWTNVDDTNGWYAGITGGEKFGISRNTDPDTGAEFIIKQTGEIGIGTASPTSLFTIKASDNAYTGGINIIDADSSTKSGITHVNGSLFLSHDTSIDDLVLSSGVATFKGDVTIQNSSPQITLLDTTNNTDALIYSDDNGSINISADENNEQGSSAIKLYVDGSVKATLDSSGHLGVGTTSPDALIDIGVNNIITLDDTGSHTGFVGFGSYNDGSKNRAQGASYYGFGLEIDRPNQLISFNSYASTGVTTSGTDILVLKRDGKVGISTDSPAEKLHVNDGHIRLSDGYKIDWGGTNVRIDGDNSSDYFRVFTSSTERMRLNSSGNLGINESSPTTKLQITGSVGDDLIRLGIGQSADLFLGFDSTNPRILLQDNTNTNTHHFVSNGDNFIIGSNVGIGTTSPSSLLHIIDTSNPATTSGSLIVEGRRDGGANVLTLRAKDDSNPSDALPNGQGAVMRFQGFDGTDFENMGYIFTGADGQAVANGDAPSFMAFGTSADGSSSPAERMRITSEGYLGIGTSSPDKPLHISSSDNQPLRIESTDAYSGIELKDNGSSTLPPLISALSDDLILYGGNSTTRPAIMFLDSSSSNVGIGTTSPAQKLHIHNTATLTATYQKFTNGTATTGSTLGIDADGDFLINNGEEKEIKLYTNDTQRLTIQSGGNVGIATTSPSEKLHINGGLHVSSTANLTSGSTGLFMDYRSNESRLYSVAWGSAYKGMQFDALELKFATGSGSASERMRITSDGLVGIGLTPTVPLDILAQNGTTDVSSITYNNIFRLRGTDSGGLFFLGKTSDQDQVIQTTNNDADLILGTRTGSANFDRLHIQGNTGNVGIGTNAPASNLHILGTSNDTVSQANANLNVEGQGGNGLVIGTIASSPYSTYIQSGFVDNFSTAVYPLSLNPLGANVGIGTTSPSSKLHIDGSNSSATKFTEGLRVTRETVSTQFGMLNYNGGTYNLIATNTAGTGTSIRFMRSDNGSDITTSMTIDGSGNLGIGTTSPDTNLHVFKASAGSVSGNANATLTLENDVANYINFLVPDSKETGVLFGRASNNADGGVIYNSNLSRGLEFRTAGNAYRMGITSVGDVLVGTTSVNGTGGITIRPSGAGGGSNGAGRILFNRADTTATSNVIEFNNNGSAVGGIEYTNTATAYNTSSDYRLKEDLQDFNALDIASRIKMYDFKWKADDSRSYGVMAHELEEVLPQAVSGKKDAEEMQSVDYSKLVPILLKSIQELKAEIDELKKNK